MLKVIFYQFNYLIKYLFSIKQDTSDARMGGLWRLIAKMRELDFYKIQVMQGWEAFVSCLWYFCVLSIEEPTQIFSRFDG
jgi:hypothetical protein